MGLTIRIHHPLVRTEPTGQGQRRAVAEQSSSEVATCASSSESMIRKPSSGLDALHTVGDSPGGAPVSPSAFYLRTHLAPNTPPVYANDAQGIHLTTKVRMTSRHREGTLVPGSKASHASTVRARPYIPRREEAPPDRRHSHCHSRISRGITDASSVVAGLMSCNGAVPVADPLEAHTQGRSEGTQG